MAQNKPRIGWIGMGRMGYPMAERLLKAGYDVSIWNRTRSKAEPLAKIGGKVVDNLFDLKDVDVLFSIVSTGKDLDQVYFGKNSVTGHGGKVPKIFVDCSTISVEESAAIRDRLSQLGSEFVAAPVSGNAKVVTAGKLTIVASGPRAAFDVAKPYLDALGVGTTYVGEGELARMVKICHNLILGVLAQSLAEVTVLAEKGGVPRHAFLEFINNSVVGSMFSRYKSPALVNLDWTPTFTPVLLRKDLDLGLKAAKELHVPLELTQLTRDIVNRAVEAGHTDCDFAILLDQQAKASGLTLKPENVVVDDGLKKKAASAV